MNENIDQNFWKKKLEEEGMPEELPPVAKALEEQGEARQLLLNFDPDLEVPINRLADLPEELQDNIFAYILHERNEGMPKEKVAELLNRLIDRTFEMLNMGAGESDIKTPTPKSNLEPELDKRAEEVIARVIREAETTIMRDNFKDKGHKSTH